MKTVRTFLTILLAFAFTYVLSATFSLSPVGSCLLFGAFTLSAFTMPANVLGTFNFASLEWPDGSDNMGGLGVISYFIPVSKVTSQPSLVNGGLVGEYGLSVGEYWRKFYSTLETSNIEDAGQGERDGRSFAQKGHLFFPGTLEQAIDFVRAANNTGFLWCFIDAQGMRRMIGSKEFPASLEISATTGTKTADKKGVSIDVKSYGNGMAPYYKGVIQLSATESLPALS